ncbi:hypothetical protein DL763_003572 [Monosporascus cannonballus]|nr:hypothetical protein DL763_003572 [Monosporascus cannonballus]
MAALRIHLSEVAVAGLVALLKDKDGHVRNAAAEALRRQSILSEGAVAALVALLKDEDWHVRRAAAEAVGSQSNLSEGAVVGLATLLKDKDRSVRDAAAEALRGHSTLPEAAVPGLVALLKDEDEGVRREAVRVLRRQSTLSEGAVAGLIALLKDKDWHLRRAAAEALGCQSNLSDKILEVIGLLRSTTPARIAPRYEGKVSRSLEFQQSSTRREATWDQLFDIEEAREAVSADTGAEKMLGPKHHSTLSTMNNLGNVPSSPGTYEEAKAMHRQALKLTEEVLGPKHPSTLDPNNLVNQTLELREAVLRREQLPGP